MPDIVTEHVADNFDDDNLSSDMLITAPSSAGGGGYQSVGCAAPPGLHDWSWVSGADLAYMLVSNDGINWRQSALGLSFGQHRIAAVIGSDTVANRLWALTSTSSTGTGATDGRLLRGTYDPGTGFITWTQVAQLQGTNAAGPNHPRQTGRLIALDEANDTLYVGSRNGVYRFTISTNAITQRALTGAWISGLAVVPSDTNTLIATVRNDGTSAGVHRITNARTGTVAVVTYTTITNPQDLHLVTIAGTAYAYVAAYTQGLRRWTVGSDITLNWTTLTGTYNLGGAGNGLAAVGVFPGASLATTTIIATNSGETSSSNAGAYSTNGGTTWVNESSGWTVSTIPWGETDPWWLGVLKASMMLTGGSYDCHSAIIDPSNSSIFLLFGRSGVWRFDGTTFRPSIRGLNSTVGHHVAYDPTNPARALIGDGDWTVLTSDDGFTVDMPTMHNPNGFAGVGRGVAFRQDNGRVAVALDDGDVVISSNPFAASPTWTTAGFSATGACMGVAIGVDGAGDQVILTHVSGVGIRRKVGTGAPTTVHATASTGNLTPRFCWPNGHTGTDGVVYCSYGSGLLRSTNFGATWTTLHSKTNTSEYTGSVVFDPSVPTTLYYTVDNGVSGDTGVWKITGADGGSSVATKIGPTVTDPGPLAIHPTNRSLYLATTAEESGGPKLYQCTTVNPGVGTVWTDRADIVWRAGVTQPHSLDVNSAGQFLVANKQGGYYVAVLETVSGITLTGLDVAQAQATADPTLTVFGASTLAGLGVVQAQATADPTLTVSGTVVTLAGLGVAQAQATADPTLSTVGTLPPAPPEPAAWWLPTGVNNPNNHQTTPVFQQLSGKAGSRRWSYRFELLDANLNRKFDLYEVLGGRVVHQYLADIKRQATFTIRDLGRINYLSDKLRPYIRLHMPPYGDDDWVEWPMGVFVLTTPTRHANENDVVTREVEGFDLLQELSDDKVSSRYTVVAGANVVHAAYTLISPVTPKWKYTRSNETMTAAKEWPPGTSKLTIANNLLAIAEYESVAFDGWGTGILKPYQPPEERSETWRYEYGSSSLMIPEVDQELDLFNVPNKIVAVVSEPDQPLLTASATNNNPASPTSTVRRGRTIVEVLEEVEASSQNVLNGLVLRKLRERAQIYEHLTFETSTMPFHGTNDVLYLNYDPLGINARYSETSWEIDLEAGAPMKHEARRLVQI